MSNPHMYLLVFKKPTESQIDRIRNTFSDFDWGLGFDVEKVVADCKSSAKSGPKIG